MEEQENRPEHAGHETSDADVKPIVQFLIGLGVLIVFVMGLMTVLFNYLESSFERTGVEVSPLIDTQQVPPGPRLQADPAVDLRTTREWEKERLQTYGWVNEDTGVFRVPIDRAIELLAESGLPARTTPSEDGAAAGE